MKKVNYSILALLLVIGFVFVILTSFSENDFKSRFEPAAGETFAIPDEINSIMDNKCFGCHNSESTNDKAKDKLLIDKLSELSKTKLIAKLNGIAETVGKNEMPPEKFLAKYPDKALTKEESKQLKEWAEMTTEELMK